LEFWLKLDGAYLYQVETTIIDKINIFDMNNTELMKTSSNMDKYANLYWKKKKSINYTPECLSRKRTIKIVSLILCNDDKMRKRLYRVTRGHFPGVIEDIGILNDFINRNNLEIFIKDDKKRYLDPEEYRKENSY
jgi:hypothetical protein